MGTSTCRVMNGRFVNPAGGGTVLFCDTEQREERTPLTPFLFAKPVLLEIHLILIPTHVCRTPTFSLPME